MRKLSRMIFIKSLIFTSIFFISSCDKKIDDLYIYFAQAITNGDVEKMNNAVKYGADVNHYFNSGRTPLILAIEYEQLKSVKYLLKHGANINQSENKKNYYKPLHRAIQKNNLKIIKELISNNANINSKNKKGNTALAEATIYGDLDLVKYLHSKGGKISMTQLHFVNNLQVAQYIINNGKNIDDYNITGITALHMAVIDNNINYIKLLIKNGANVNKKTIKKGYTSLTIGKSYLTGTSPLQLAKICNIKNSHKKIITLLKKHGAE